MQFIDLQNLYDVAVSLGNGHILNPSILPYSEYEMNARVIGMIREWEWDCIIIINMRNAELINSRVDFQRIFILHFHLIIPSDGLFAKTSRMMKELCFI